MLSTFDYAFLRGLQGIPQGKAEECALNVDRTDRLSHVEFLAVVLLNCDAGAGLELQ